MRQEPSLCPEGIARILGSRVLQDHAVIVQRDSRVWFFEAGSLVASAPPSDGSPCVEPSMDRKIHVFESKDKDLHPPNHVAADAAPELGQSKALLQRPPHLMDVTPVVAIGGKGETFTIEASGFGLVIPGVKVRKEWNKLAMSP